MRDQIEDDHDAQSFILKLENVRPSYDIEQHARAGTRTSVTRKLPFLNFAGGSDGDRPFPSVPPLLIGSSGGERTINYDT
jgi:hypothetical protein